jgi:hypothetical protein
MSWPALLLSPLLALAAQACAYALASPGCAQQRGPWLHAVPLVFLLLALALTVLAWRDMRRRAPGAPHADADRRGANGYFVACAATGTGALSSLAIVALWVPLWWLSPCVS